MITAPPFTTPYLLHNILSTHCFALLSEYLLCTYAYCIVSLLNRGLITERNDNTNKTDTVHAN